MRTSSDVTRPSSVRRCAIYTRRSSDRGLQQDFNSLEAQQAICSAYIQSQQHKGWVQLHRIYEDPAQSRATLDRPAMHISYRSNQNAWGKSHGVKRISVRSMDVESIVVSALQSLLCDRERLRSLLLDLGLYGVELTLSCHKGPIAGRRLEALGREQLRSVLHGLIVRVEVSRERIKFVTWSQEIEHLLDWDFIGLFRPRPESLPRATTYLIDVPCAGAVRLERHVRLPITARKPQSYRINKRLRELVMEARNAWTLIEANRDLSAAEIAKRNNYGLSHLMRLLRLDYLAPDIKTAIMDGAQPREINRRSLLDANLPLDWALQRKMFGFPEQPPMRTTESPY